MIALFVRSRGVALFSSALNFSLAEPEKSLNPRLADILRRKQVNLVVESPSRLYAIVDGIENAMRECKHQHRDRLWDCPTYANSTSGRYLFGKIVNQGESADGGFLRRQLLLLINLSH